MMSTSQATLIGLAAIVLWSAIGGLLRNVGEVPGPAGGAAMLPVPGFVVSIAGICRVLGGDHAVDAAGMLANVRADPLRYGLALAGVLIMVSGGAILCWLATRAKRPAQVAERGVGAIARLAPRSRVGQLRCVTSAAGSR